MELSMVSVVGAAFALLAAIALTVQYVFLIKLRGNRGAQMFFSLLLVIDGLLGLNGARVFLGDYTLRIPLLTVGFYLFGFILVGISIMLWKNQMEGARAARKIKE